MSVAEGLKPNWWEVQALGMVEPIEIVLGAMVCDGCRQEIRAHRLNPEFFELGPPLESTRILCGASEKKVAPLPHGTSITIYDFSVQRKPDEAVVPLGVL